MTDQIDGKAVERCYLWSDEYACGTWVRASDYDALLSERDALQAQVDGLTKERNAQEAHAMEFRGLWRAALAREDAASMEVRSALMAYLWCYTDGHALKMREKLLPLPTDAAAALARREDEVIEECAVHIETVWSNEIADDLRRALKRSGKETK